MSRGSPEVNQLAMFGDNGQANASVSVKKRAKHLHKALSYYNQATRDLFIPLGVRIDPRKPLNYGEVTKKIQNKFPQVPELVKEIQEDLVKKSKREFWQATGLIAMVQTAVISEEAAKELARTMWDNFTQKYDEAPDGTVHFHLDRWEQQSFMLRDEQSPRAGPSYTTKPS